MTRARDLLTALLLLVFSVTVFSQAQPRGTNVPSVGPLHFIDTSFENASPLWYETAPSGDIRIHLLYDHEQNSPNRAAGHIHFLIHAEAGAKLVFEFLNLDNVWNSRPGSVAPEMQSLVVSRDGTNWNSVRPEIIDGKRVRLSLEMPGPQFYIARIEPYRISDLDRLLSEIRNHPRVEISEIGKTVEGRPLEIIRIGKATAPRRVFLRARAHPWESGSSWVAHGLIQRLLKDDANVAKYLETYCLYVLPMANKDGVARGRTRFNSRGKDLNRDWNAPADPLLAPENHALEKWLDAQIATGRRPDLALELHNDGSGRLHLSRPAGHNIEDYLKRMQLLERLLREHTWFSEGATPPSFSNSGTLGEGWLRRHGIDAVVHEFNCHWIATLKRPPLARDWQDYGVNLATVFDAYFRALK